MEVRLRKESHQFAQEIMRLAAWNHWPFIVLLYKFSRGGSDDNDVIEFTYSEGTVAAIGNSLIDAGWPVFMVSNKADTVVWDRAYAEIIGVDPREVPFEPPRAALLELPNDRWDGYVRRLACMSSLVVVVLEGESGGLYRELAMIEELGVSDRMVVLRSPEDSPDSRIEEHPSGQAFSSAIQARMPLDATFSPCWVRELTDMPEMSTGLSRARDLLRHPGKRRSSVSRMKP